MDRLAGFADGVFAEALTGFSAADHATLLALLERVRTNLSANMPDDVMPSAPHEPLESMIHG